MISFANNKLKLFGKQKSVLQVSGAESHIWDHEVYSRILKKQYGTQTKISNTPFRMQNLRGEGYMTRLCAVYKQYKTYLPNLQLPAK